VSRPPLSPRSVRFLTISYQADGLVESPASDRGANQREFRQTVVYKDRANYLDPKIRDSRIARLRLLREPLLDHRLGKGLSTPPDALKRKSVLSASGQKGFSRGSCKYMKLVHRKCAVVVVSSVKVPHQPLRCSNR
jgi:hypothetical protein